MKTFPNSLSPFRIKSLEIKNRYVMSPMETKQAHTDGSVSDGIIEYYRRRAEGGVGLIMVEAAFVHPTGKGFSTQLAIDRDEMMEGLSRIPEKVHPYGTKVAIQLIHHGRQTESRVLGGIQPVSASPIPYNLGEVPRALTEGEIEELIQAFAEACRRAKQAGFDAAEIHSAHGYLIQTFLSPHSNHREDRYGRDLEGRMRFALEVIRRSRETVGPDFPLFTRVSHREDHEGGYEVDYMERVVPHMVGAGIDVLDVSVGNYNSIHGIGIPIMDLPMGLNVEGASSLKKAAGVPTIVVGRLNDPMLAEQVISNGQADMIALGRQLLADPDYLKKIEKGDLEDIRYCLACNDGCLMRMVREDRVSCSVNPECAHELDRKILPAKSTKRIWVIGAGPAGLSAAYYSALRGHQVTLWEKGEAFGGQWIAASKSKNKVHLARLINFYRKQMDQLGVEVNLGRAVREETLKAGNMDFVVLASGAMPATLPVPDDGTVQMVQAVDVLLNKINPAGKIVVVGASLTGVEVADYVSETSKEVIVIEALKKLPINMGDRHGRFLYQKLGKAGVKVVLNAPLAKIEKGSVFYSSNENIEEIKDVNLVILAVGSRSERSLVKFLAETGIPSEIIGDAVKPRTLHDAIHEGFKVSQMI